MNLRKEIIRIAHDHGAKVRFSSRVSVPYVDVKSAKISLDIGRPKRVALSDFFHELGHIVDYRAGKFPSYYVDLPSKRALKRFSLKAELHTDKTGARLMRKYFPKIAFAETYKYKKWQKFHNQYWGIE